MGVTAMPMMLLNRHDATYYTNLPAVVSIGRRGCNFIWRDWKQSKESAGLAGRWPRRGSSKRVREVRIKVMTIQEFKLNHYQGHNPR
jgi:hypothetical protein